jgi:hypothetical protein
MASLDDTYAKIQAEKAYYAQTQGTCATPMSSNSTYYGECPVGEPFTLRGEAEQKVGFHRSLAEKADQAAAFFRENPAFDQFIRLIRSGAVQI